MRQHGFGRLAPVSVLTLGGGGLGMLWGETSFAECGATVHEAVEAGITLFDLAPRYGDGKAEEVVGAAFAGRLPEGARVTSKCNLGEAAPGAIGGILRRSIEGSLARFAAVAARPVLPALECRAGPGTHGAPCRCRFPHDAVFDLCRACPAGVRAARRRGHDRRL